MFVTAFPGHCRFCNTPLLTLSRIPVCDACVDAIQALDEPVCAVCGERLLRPVAYDSTSEDAAELPRCTECLRMEPPFQRALAYGSYEGGLRELIHLLKYERVRPAAAVLGRMLGEAVTELVPEFSSPGRTEGGEFPVLVPVPLHESKERQRGFNQSELIARAMLKSLAGTPLTVNASALRRNRATESQTGLSRGQRRANLRGAFAVVRSNEVAGRDILIVDDVYTTGTTVAECARVLRRAGANRIWVATVARVLKVDSTRAPSTQLESELDRRSTIADAPLARAAQA